MKNFKKVVALAVALITVFGFIPSTSLAQNNKVINLEEEGVLEITNPNLLHENGIGLLKTYPIRSGKKVSVLGGTLWAQFKGAAHRGNYVHSKKVHRSSALNGARMRTRSAWEKPGVKAVSPWLDSSLRNNKVKANTK